MKTLELSCSILCGAEKYQLQASGLISLKKICNFYLINVGIIEELQAPYVGLFEKFLMISLFT